MKHHLQRTKSRYSTGNSNRLSDTKEEDSEDTNRISNGPNIYQIGSQIGKGAFGEVFQAFNVRTGDLVAVKRFPLNSIDQESLSSVEGEVELMQRLNHPNIVKYVDTIKTRSYLYIVLEYMENGSLANVIDKFGSLTESLTAIYVTQILKGLKYLHDQGVLHRDIKGANILTTKDGLVKLADFGVAIKMSDAGNDEQDIAGTPYWMAPEIIEMSTPTPACDIWSVGCIIIELLTGRPPYFELQAPAAIFKIVTDEYPPFPEGISQALRDFLFNCFRKEPGMRSSAAQLLLHPWLHNSATNTNLERQSTMLLGASRSSSSKDGSNTKSEADGVINAIKLFQREVSPQGNNSSQQNDERTTSSSADGIAMREIRVETGSNSLSHDQSLDEYHGKRREIKGHELTGEIISPTATDIQKPKFERDRSSSSTISTIPNTTKLGHDHKDGQSDHLTNRGLFRHPSDNALIKRILSSDTTVVPIPNSPDRDNNKTPENTPLEAAVRKLTLTPSRPDSASSGGSGVGKRLSTPKASFRSLKGISEDSVDSWDAEIIAGDLKSTSNESAALESRANIRQIDLAAVKKGFISSNASFLRPDSIGRRLPSSINILRTKSAVSVSNSMDSIRYLQKGGSDVLSPQHSTYFLSKYQEKPEEETYDDLLEPANYIEHDDPFENIDNLSSADTQDRGSSERSIQTHFPMQIGKSTSTGNHVTTTSNRPPLEALQSMSSEDYDDLFEETDTNGTIPNLANKLKQKLTNWSKELAEDEMDSFINHQFEEKDFQQDEQKDIHFRRSKEIVDLLNKIRPTMTNEEILDITNQILALFDKYPEQRDHVITNHGVMPIMDMFEDNITYRSTPASTGITTEGLRFEIYGYNVLKIVNKIVEGSVRAQEQLSLVGIIPSIIRFFERSCRSASPRRSNMAGNVPRKSLATKEDLILDSSGSNNSSRKEDGVGSREVASNSSDSGRSNPIDEIDLDPLAMEAARFIHTISISSSLTLQMLISAGGLSVLTTMASFGRRISSGTNHHTTSTHRRLHSWEELIKREEIRRHEEVEEVLDVESPHLLNVITDRIYDSDSKRYIEIFQMGMDCISRVFAAQKSRTRDFCRLFVKFGLLTHLASAFDNLMTIYKSFLQKSQHQRDHYTIHPESTSAFRLQKSFSDSGVVGTIDEGSTNHRRNSSGNISRSDSSTSMDASGIDNCSEALYAQAIAAVFFKFSRSDAVVAETMANAEKGVIGVILSTLQAPELKNVETGSSMNLLLTNSPGSSMILPTGVTPTSGHRRTRSGGPQPAYVEIVELLLKCLKNLSMEPSAIECLGKAGTIETLVPLLNGPIAEKCKIHVLPCIFNMCRINRRRFDQAAILGIVPHLKKVITEGSHLRQFALPILFDLAHGSPVTREVLWKENCVEFYLDLLKENYWQTFALNSLAVWLSNEMVEKDASKGSNVAKLLIQPPCLLKLIEFFRNAGKQTLESIHRPLLDMITKSKELSCALGMSGVFVSSLVKRLHTTTEAIVLRSLLKMLQLIHQNHPCPRQLVLDNNLYKLVKEFAQSETKVVVQQIANRLLADFQVSTLT